MKKDQERTGETRHDALAAETIADPRAFIRAVTDCAEHREIVASEDIFARGGMKLVNRGTRLSGHFHERLVAHKLLKPIEQTIAVADAPDARSMIALAHAEASRIPSLQPLLGPELLARLDGLVGEIRIPQALSTKIAIMQDERPRLFRHSMLAATVAMVLGIRGNLPREELHALALASALHDIGELYIAPELLADEHALSTDERRHVYAHPITGYLLLREFSELPPGTAEAVLQHHERLDGIGYPYGLAADRISRVARHLAVAEVSASLIAKHGADRRVGIKFRMNIKKYDPQAVALICQLFDDAPADAAADHLDEHALIDRLAQLGRLFSGWDTLLATCPPADLETVANVIDRINGLRALVLEPGCDQYHLDDLLDAIGEVDPDICLELSALLDEATWHLGALCRAVERDREIRDLRIPPALRSGFEAWIDEIRTFVTSVGHAN